MRFSEHVINNAEEKHIVTGLIVSTEFCKRITEYIDLDYFKNSYLKTLAEWSILFYQEHSKAPFLHINDIFESYRKTIKEADAELMDELLSMLGKQYTGNDVNVDFLADEAEEYFRKRELEIHVNNISVLSEKGDLESAEEEIARFNKISIKLDESIYINPGDEAQREKLYRKREQESKEFFNLPGDLGKFLGNFAREDVIGITAPAKRGKSFLLTTLNKHAILSNIQTLKFSIEMTDTQEITRFDKAFYPSVSEEGWYYYPEFDCLKNQMGNCGDRLSQIIVKEDEKSPVVYNKNHIVCTKCKDSKDEYKRYEPAVYKKEIWRPANTHHNVKKALKKWLPTFDKYSRIVVRPKYSLTYDLMMRDIDIMATRYNFIPRIILMDYIDILGIASQYDDYRLVDEAWKLLQKVAGRTKCLVVSPTQADKEGHKVEMLDTTNQAGFYGKSRHVNMMWGINQTPSEKDQGLFRLSILDSRSSYQSKNDFCTVLQDLGAGQMYIDSYWKNKFSYSGKVR